MKTSIAILASVTVATLLVAGCKSKPPHDKGPYMPAASKAPDLESTQSVVLMDAGVQYSLTTTLQTTRTLPDGRLEVIVGLRNREARRIEVQANCVFKDEMGVSTGDETPFQTVILTENATEQVKFTSMNAKAKKYTVRVRQAR
ncbi:MAG TPA: hypothetical protein PKA41_08515 [Verrucomicrobiota bacterium]|nr:hypothetical protein [Verrucomicrobiota bacterium]